MVNNRGSSVGGGGLYPKGRSVTLSKLLNVMVNLTIVILSILAITVLGPEIETRWFPVYSKFRILKIEPGPEGGSTVTVEFSKFRNCIPQGYAWYNGDFGNNYRQLEVTSRRPNPSPSLPIGRTHSTLDVRITPDEFASGIWAETFSRCHPFWVTRSVVFP